MESFIINYGILAIALLLFIDDLGVPLPGTTIVFSSAIIASQTPEISVCQLFIVALLIPSMGNTILFYFGRHGFRKWLNTHGHKVFLPEKRIQRAEQIFKKYGEKTIFIAAMITSVRSVSSIIAGGLNMHPMKFLFYHFSGVFVWATVVVGTGYFFGNQIWDILKNHWQSIILLIFILLIIKSIYKYYGKKNIIN